MQFWSNIALQGPYEASAAAPVPAAAAAAAAGEHASQPSWALLMEFYTLSCGEH